MGESGPGGWRKSGRWRAPTSRRTTSTAAAGPLARRRREFGSGAAGWRRAGSVRRRPNNQNPEHRRQQLDRSLGRHGDDPVVAAISWLIERRSDVLVYTSRVFGEGSGLPEPHPMRPLRRVVRARQADFAVKLIDVFPYGRAINLCKLHHARPLPVAWVATGCSSRARWPSTGSPMAARRAMSSSSATASASTSPAATFRASAAT